MPKTEVKKVVCLKCGKTTEVKLSTSINAAEDLNMRRELLSGRLFSFKCSACGYTGKLFYPVLYNDPKNKFMVYLIPDVDRFQIADKDIEKDFDGGVDNVRKRIVPDFNSFLEKIYIFECGLDDMAVCYNPIDSESIRALAKQAPPVEVDANMLNLCAVGRLVPVKGFARLIPILRRLLDEGLPVHLYICGEGAQRQKLEQTAQDAGVTPYVTLTGFLDNPYALMARCDLFVCSSFREGFSSAAAEALLCHLPVVTVDVPGMAELLNGSGVICENDDEALYLALRDVLLDENKRHLLRQSAAKRSKFFDIHSSVRAIEALLEAR